MGTGALNNLAQAGNLLRTSIQALATHGYSRDKNYLEHLWVSTQHHGKTD